MWPYFLPDNYAGFSLLFHHVYNMHSETCWKKYPLNFLIKKKRWFLLSKSNFCVNIFSHAMGSHILIMCSWMLVEKAGETLLKEEDNSILEVICLLYIKSQHFLQYLGVTLFLNMLEWWIPYILFCEVREIERKHSPSLMIKIPSVEALHYSTFQNRKDELLLQWHRSNLKLESIALPTLNTKDVHCLQTDFFLSVCKTNDQIFFFSLEKPLQWKNCSWFCASHPGLQEGFLLHSVISS